GQGGRVGRGSGRRRARRRVAGGGWFRTVRGALGAHRGAAGCRRPGSRGGVEQLRGRRLGTGPAADGPADPADGRLLRGGEQGVRPSVPLRRARGGADSAGDAGRAAARRRVRDRRLLHRDGRGHAGGRGRAAVEVRRGRVGRGRLTGQGGAVVPGRRRGARLRPRAGHHLRLRAGPCLEGRPPRKPRLPALRAQLQPAGGDGRAGDDRGGRAPGRAGRARRRRRPHPGSVRAAGGGAERGAGRREAHREADGASGTAGVRLVRLVRSGARYAPRAIGRGGGRRGQGRRGQCRSGRGGGVV
ncbi:MAG: Succinyl-CoA:3-ketoacid-coenzyme A transferase subunit A, partial [uncultured Nocardioidaceae bacterium]